MHRLRCHCGAVRGHVADGRPSTRVRCYCRDCQAFGRFFGAEAGVLDAHGGTEIVQVAQSRLHLEEGRDRLACLRLAPRGLLRWYTSCCHTPIGNTLANPKVSLIGLVDSCLDREALERDFGASVAEVHTGSALGEPKPRAHGLLRTFRRALVLIARERMTGRYRRSPLFTAEGAPVADPHLLRREQA